ncbi:sodium-dependent transporter [Psychrobium sp. 1_MG-2023]|uniref:sodium-dependent transporter n=1 Tax=Psychrobium sp. 1_MG-2023 TaxID=3062624 RepID=UPI000C320E48|nr:sodium-dependent transporter [Psychrobium sp. 1_MG-2023]MDP2561154.1 sodium-dependent transporter [Psychrobium sp. 1_MG-2023]PKF55128.1 sodium-dependent transporter [Alteromonadales bacterium alter-6D02]
MNDNREQFSSKLGFILAAAGSAVGIGNLVGFPVNAAKNGGGAFLVIYAIFVILICLPVMVAEFAMGRHTKKGPVGAFGTLSGQQPFWRGAGLIGVITPFMIGVFYTVISVWILGYLIMAAVGELEYLASPDSFGQYINSPYIFAAMLGVAAIIYLILKLGVQDGIEKASKILMPALFVMLLALVGFVLTLDNASAGISFYIIPQFDKITASVVNGALSQAFFSLSLGMGILLTYGSYLSRKTNIVSSAKMVALTDTSVAFIAGLMILPAIFSFNPDVNPSELSDSSVSLIFVLLPKIFLALQTSIGFFAASAIATLFFLLVFFAAITSLVSIIEVPVAYLIDEKNKTRKQALTRVGAIGGGLTVACALSFGMVAFFTEMVTYGGGMKSFFDIIYDLFYDTILPLNGLLVCLFVSYRWKRHELNKELSVGNDEFEGSLMQKYINFSLSTFIPVILLAIFINTVAQKYFSSSLFGF